MKEKDPVNPSYYHPITINGKKFKTIDVLHGIISSCNYSASEAADVLIALKYILRYPDKGHPEVDIDKAIWYLKDVKKRMVNKEGSFSSKHGGDANKEKELLISFKTGSKYLHSILDDLANYENKSKKEDKHGAGEIFNFISDVLNTQDKDESSSNTSKSNTFDTGKFAVMDSEKHYFSTLKDLDEDEVLKTLNGKVKIDSENLNEYLIFSDNFDSYFELRFKLQEVDVGKETVVTMHVFYDRDQLEAGKDKATKLIYSALQSSVPYQYYDYVKEDKDNYMMDISKTITIALKNPEEI